MSTRLRCSLLAAAALGLARPALAEPITLNEAVERTLAASPLGAAGEASVRSAEAGRTQAAVRPNPVVTAQAEDFIGSGAFDQFRQAETTLSYAQTLERGGKRAARIGFAERNIVVAQERARVSRLDLAQAVQRAFLDVQIAEEVVWLAEARLATEQAMRTEALRRVRGYKDPLFVETRADARVSEAELAVNEASLRRDAARARLASFWGGNGAEIEVPRGIEKPTDRLEQLAAADDDLAAAVIDQARAAVVVEQSRAVQDYTVSGGLRHFRATGDVALVAGVSIPLGRFDRNQGNIAAAQANRQQAELQAEAGRLDRLRTLAALRAEAEAARMRADGIMENIYPKVRKTLDQVREGYSRGGFRFSDVQDAADAVVDVQSQWVDAMTRYRDVLSQIDRLTGRFDVLAEETQP
ncbi:metal transporter [Novosphingobium sediminis]|uniref:Metal transporter n=1 Tax=Novosphingobium sediminis TaxID=707214 RepID=A0A512AQU1_9SPHN|nr:TolC family protein [Novosphingobium sediminis]GEO02032.1 metal transporter [Novosphingobium sediminis]